jgi:hypothetical protein
MNYAVARVQSERASIYLQQLCKHFGHRIPVEFTPERGAVSFPFGTCHLAAAGGVLTMQAEAADADGLARVQDVMDRHLSRFAFRDPPKVAWKAAASPGEAGPVA